RAGPDPAADARPGIGELTHISSGAWWFAGLIDRGQDGRMSVLRPAVDRLVERVGQADEVEVQRGVLDVDVDVRGRGAGGDGDAVAEHGEVGVVGAPREPHGVEGGVHRVVARGPAPVDEAVLET